MPEHDKRGASGRGSAQLCVELLEDRLVLAAGSITPPPPPAPADTSATTATMTDSYSAPTPGPSQDGDGQAAPLAMSPVADGDGDSPAEYAPQTAGNPTAPSSVPVQTQAYPPTGTEARAAVQEQMMYYRPAPGQRDTDEASEYYPPATTAVSQSVAVNAARSVAGLVHASGVPEASAPT